MRSLRAVTEGGLLDEGVMIACGPNAREAGQIARKHTARSLPLMTIGAAIGKHLPFCSSREAVEQAQKTCVLNSMQL